MSSPVALTTTFVPPAVCSFSPSSLYVWDNFGILELFPDRVQAGNIAEPVCFPSGYVSSSYFSPAPSICPVGFTIACQGVNGPETTATCCYRYGHLSAVTVY